MKTKWIALALLISSPAFAFSQDDELHLAAHAGASFALQTGLYGVNSRWLGMDPALSEGLALAETLALGVLYKGAEHFPSDTTTSLVEDVAGASSAILVHVVFQF